ncbi:hypothetical protein NC651_008024 [Populus alba x Populus x berolinensis]|nr:hypothetical protein NC651_008024 [Populus alba x Populus x berolinensis]
MVNPWKTYWKLYAVLMGSHGLIKGSLAFLNYPAQIMFKSTKQWCDSAGGVEKVTSLEGGAIMAAIGRSFSTARTIEDEMRAEENP